MAQIDPPDAKMSFEAAMERLDKIVEQMESSKLPLEELLVRYEEGIRLVAVCNEQLAEAENRIETLNRNASNTVPVERPKEMIKEKSDESSLF
jgi:exodeoxyribonuclease VII small subunit